MKIIPLGHTNAVAIQLYKPKADDDPFSMNYPREEIEIGARKLIEVLEDDSCIAFLEALILESKKAINRHAAVCAEHSEDWDPPEWATKYMDVGL